MEDTNFGCYTGVLLERVGRVRLCSFQRVTQGWLVVVRRLFDVVRQNGIRTHWWRAMAVQKTLTLWSVTALGIGSMIGAGIFALLGQATVMAGRDVVLSFIVAGVVALFAGYSYAKLAARYPTSGGIVDYLENAFATPALAGGLSLVYLITLAVSISMVAKTFGEYASAMLLGFTGVAVHVNIPAGGILVLLGVLNMVGTGAVGRAEGVLVGLKLAILFGLMVAGLPTIDIGRMAAEPATSTANVLGSVGLTFFAFAGFGMMTNASSDVHNPAKTIPRAIFIAITLVLIIYVSLGLLLLGTLSRQELVAHMATALAEAAKPVLGKAGFYGVSFAALLATTSSINAMLFSSTQIAKGMAETGCLPAWFARRSWGQGTVGLFWGLVGILLLTMLFDLRAIANVASATFLISYLAVFLANWKLRVQTGSSPLMIITGASLMLAILGAFMLTMYTTQPTLLWFTATLVGSAIALEWFLRRRKK